MKYIFPAFKFDYEQIVRKFSSKIEFEYTFPASLSFLEADSLPVSSASLSHMRRRRMAERKGTVATSTSMTSKARETSTRRCTHASLVSCPRASAAASFSSSSCFSVAAAVDVRLLVPRLRPSFCSYDALRLFCVLHVRLGHCCTVVFSISATRSD